MAKSNVFTIPPGAPFLKVLAQSLCESRLVPGFRYDAADPLSLASTTIYLPTRRAARVLRSEFVDLLGGRSAILPVIRPLGETDDDAGYFDEEPNSLLDLLPPVGNLTRLIELARLILIWRNRLPEKLRAIHDDSPLVAPASPADAIWLARSLIELIDAVETEETGWEGLKAFDEADRAIWWELTGEFIKVASAFWPARLTELNRSSPALHRNLAIRAEAARVARDGSHGPVVVAGSTGSIPATADLIAAIHRLDNGAVVLPGLDQAMPRADWPLAGAIRADGSKNTDPASRSHPQYGLFHLLRKLGVEREEVTPLATDAPDMAKRIEAASVAFMPAEAEVNHQKFRDRDEGLLAEAFAGIALIEANNEREEALAIAIALKLALDSEGPAVQAALVTPDRTLARRVSAELQRFGIEADDSAGTPLAASHHGSLIRLALESILRPGDPVALASLIKHPLVRLGREREALDSASHALEMLALRGGTALVDAAALTPVVLQAIEELGKNRFSRRWQMRLRTAECQSRIVDLARDIEAAVEPLARMLVADNGNGLRAQHPLGAWAEATGKVLEALCRDERGSLGTLWSGEAGDALAGLLKDLIETAETMDATGPQWADVTNALLAGVGIKPKAIGHPRVFIWGTLEARLQSVDTLVLGALNEGTWPGATANNPFLSRAMKTEIGLEPPERRIGQSAHDFVMGMGTRKLILTRALRQGGAPSVASRFVQRLLSVTGEHIGDAMIARGERYRRYAGLIDRSSRAEEQPFAARPAPTPDAGRQPVSYSFSEAGRLRRDPYAIYARRVLRLDPLDGFNEDPGAADRGNIYHEIVQLFVESGVDPRAESALERIRDITHQVFDRAALPAHIDAVWRPRAIDMARAFLDKESERRPMIRKTYVERSAKLQVTDHLAVTGRADRIDIRKDGLADIVDYKTGSSPSAKVARTLLDPQLALEAAVLKGDGFFGVGAHETQDLIYMRLRPGSKFVVETVNNENSTYGKPESRKSASELANESISQLTKLTEALREKKAGFKSRVAPFKDADYGGEYDHLARVAEWSAAELEEETGDE
ncbi:double-strand break repair protein AddB [Rhizobium sp. LjRoot254]|uniref:double-strand break repair protein AddB n=1 Tax=Rhizobium sp. LjRoot254 TaxID=3342297 RepID=UPI003ECC695A